MRHTPSRASASAFTPVRQVALSATAALALLAGCDRAGEARPGDDTAVAQTDRPATTAGQEVREAGRDASRAAGNAADAVANKSRDVAITTEVNMRLARDDKLSALGINVDTSAGRVVLRGNAPDTASRARATELARGVDGVVEVSNELNVQPRAAMGSGTGTSSTR